jgi:hypothetical protein
MASVSDGGDARLRKISMSFSRGRSDGVGMCKNFRLSLMGSSLIGEGDFEKFWGLLKEEKRREVWDFE